MTVLNELWRVLFAYRGRVVLLAIHLDDYAIIERTLELDSQSTAFTPDIRDSLKRGIKRMKEIDIKPVEGKDESVAGIYTTKDTSQKTKRFYAHTAFARLTAGAGYHAGPWTANLALSGVITRWIVSTNTSAPVAPSAWSVSSFEARHRTL